MDKDEKIIRSAVSQIKVDATALAEKAAFRMNNEQELFNCGKHEITRKKAWKVPIAAALAALLLVSVTVTAAVTGGLDAFINRLNPAFGEVVVPVELYAVDNGIRMEVIGAQTFGNQVVAYVSVRDISGLNRFTERAEFQSIFMAMLDADSNILDSGSGISRSILLHLDEATNTAFYEVTSWNSGGDFSDKIAIVAEEFTFDFITYDSLPVNIDFSALGEPQTVNFPVTEGNITDITLDARNEMFEQGLAPTEILAHNGHFASLPHNRDGQWISNIGVIDGRLHVQMARDTSVQGLGGGMVLLKHNGVSINPLFRITVFANDENELVHTDVSWWAGARYEYLNFVFGIDINELANYSLYFYGSYTERINGYWQVIAHTGYTTAQMRVWHRPDIVINGMPFETLTLTPLGLQITGVHAEGTGSPLTLTLETTNGDIELGNGTGHFTNWPERSFSLKWMSNDLIDVPSVTAVIIEGVRIETVFCFGGEGRA